MAKKIIELDFAHYSSIEETIECLKSLTKMAYNEGGIPFTICTEYEYDHYETGVHKQYFHIIIYPISSLYHGNSDTYQNYTDGNLLYRTESYLGAFSFKGGK